MPANTIGSNRTQAFHQFAVLLIWLFVLSWTTLTIAFAVAFVWAAIHLVYKALTNNDFTWGKPWAKSMLVWNYEMLYYSLGLTSEFPGWLGWMP